MTSFVLDASALLALLLAEPGADRVKAGLDGSVMTIVNLAEVVSHYAKLGAARPDIEALLRPLPPCGISRRRWRGSLPRLATCRAPP